MLILLGLAGFVFWEQLGSEKQSPTALIPAFFGLPLVVLGVLAGKPNMRKHAMHGAAMIGLLGLLGTIRGFIAALQWMGGTTPARPAAVAFQAIMAVLCAVFVALCVRSFIEARKAREAQGFEVKSP